MKKIDRLILSSFIGPFLAALMIAMFVLVMQTLWLYIDDIAGKGLGMFIIIELLAYKCVALVPLALPIAILISSVMVMGNMAEHYELSSFKSAGVPLLRTMAPLVIVGILSGFFSYYCANYLMPIANLKFGSRMYDIQRQKPALRLDEGVFNYDFQGYAIHIGEKKGNGQKIEDVLIYDHNESNNNNQYSQISARGGEMFATPDGHYFIMKLEDGTQYVETRPTSSGSGKYPFVRTAFGEWNKVFDLSEFSLSRTDEELFKSNRSMLTIPQLFVAVDSLDRKIEERNEGFSSLVANYFYFQMPDSLRNPQGIGEPSLSPDTAPQPQFSGGGIKVNQETPNSRPSRSLRTPWNSNETLPDTTLAGKDSVSVLDTMTRFQSFIKTLPDYEQERLYSRAETFARSIKNQSESSVQFLGDLRESRVKHVYDLYTKYSMAVVCLIFIFIGAPMGAIVRKGGFGYPILISIIFFMLFVILTIFCRKIAETFVVSAVTAAWIPNAILFPVGVFLTYKAMNDSRLFDVDRLNDRLRRLFRKKKEAAA